jgi:hypothetical protein
MRISSRPPLSCSSQRPRQHPPRGAPTQVYASLMPEATADGLGDQVCTRRRETSERGEAGGCDPNRRPGTGRRHDPRTGGCGTDTTSESLENCKGGNCHGCSRRPNRLSCRPRSPRRTRSHEDAFAMKTLSPRRLGPRSLPCSLRRARFRLRQRIATIIAASGARGE